MQLPRFRQEEGQTMAEYGVVLGVTSIFVVGALMLLAGNVMSAIDLVADLFT
jgi:Flp pilus assembly pilin Flp